MRRSSGTGRGQGDGNNRRRPSQCLERESRRPILCDHLTVRATLVGNAESSVRLLQQAFGFFGSQRGQVVNQPIALGAPPRDVVAGHAIPGHITGLPYGDERQAFQAHDGGL